MSYLDDQHRAALKAIKKQERRDKDTAAANCARENAWVTYIDARVSASYTDPKGAPAVAQTNVRGNRNGADASQPWPVHSPGDSRHLEGTT